jgi:ABC-type sulfate/molybdate transport systems ATPase subunit
LSDTLLAARIQHNFGHASLDLHFSLNAPWTVLFGPSGSGKTTTLRAIAGLLRPHAARIVLHARRLTDTVSSLHVPPHLRRIGYTGPHSALFPHLNALENVRFGLHHAADSADRAHAMLRIFHVEHLAARRPTEISWGERQRILLARILAPSPRLLLLDEPFAALDLPTRAAVLDNLRDYLAANPTPVLSVTHDAAEVFALNADTIVLDAGRIADHGSPHAVLARERELLLSTLNSVNPA